VAPEPFGRVLIEAMAAGATVIGARDGAVPEIVQDGVTGMLVPPGDVDALASAMDYALRHSTQRATWQNAARQRVAARFGADDYVRGVEQVYEELLD
jgi:mannosyltransferase